MQLKGINQISRYALHFQDIKKYIVLISDKTFRLVYNTSMTKSINNYE